MPPPRRQGLPPRAFRGGVLGGSLSGGGVLGGGGLGGSVLGGSVSGGGGLGGSGGQRSTWRPPPPGSLRRSAAGRVAPAQQCASGGLLAQRQGNFALFAREHTGLAVGMRSARPKPCLPGEPGPHFGWGTVLLGDVGTIVELYAAKAPATRTTCA